MLFDVRTYTTRPGTLQKQLELYRQHGFTTQRKYLGSPFAFLIPETGTSHSFTHIWCYKNAADREQKREAMKSDPLWAQYVKLTAEAGYYTHQSNQLMNDSFFMQSNG